MNGWANFNHIYIASCGAGDYGKLGHGLSATQKQPKLIDSAPLNSKVVTHISAGYRHSAAVTSDGELYTWGEGEHGRLGDYHPLRTNNYKNKDLHILRTHHQIVCLSYWIFLHVSTQAVYHHV